MGKNGDLRNMIIDKKKNVEGLLSSAIIQHDLSFSFVEYKWIRELLFYLHLRLKNFSRNKIVFNLWRIHVDEKENVKLAMHIAHCRICLTADG